MKIITAIITNSADLKFDYAQLLLWCVLSFTCLHCQKGLNKFGGITC